MDLSRVIIKPYHTEKSYSLRDKNDIETLTFVVDMRANKYQIREAFVAVYGVQPEKINVVKKHPAKTRVATAKPGYTKAKKIAYVVLPKGVKVATEEATENASESK